MNEALVIRDLLPGDEKTFLTAYRAFGKMDPGFTFAYNYQDGMHFQDYCLSLQRQKLGLDLPVGFVPTSMVSAFLDGQIVGRANIRHELNEFLANVGGHIGYGVVPSFRGRGFAKQLLKFGVDYLSSLGVKKTLVTCDEGNIPSQKVIESQGGVFENHFEVGNGKPPKRRYWIQTTYSQ